MGPGAEFAVTILRGDPHSLAKFGYREGQIPTKSSAKSQHILDASFVLNL
jgi:hypothetical protein